MKKKVNKYLYWTPRILSFVFAAFLIIFSFDVFDGTSGFWQTALALFIHNIPSLILIAVAIIAWKRELVGAIAFGLFSLLFLISTAVRSQSGPEPYIQMAWSMIIFVPALLTAVLYYLNWHHKKKA